MTKQMILEAKRLKELYGTISSTLLMRKFKVNFKLASEIEKIVNSLVPNYKKLRTLRRIK